MQVLHSHGLRHLDLSKNALTGTLPATIGSMTNLTHLLLGSNSEWGQDGRKGVIEGLFVGIAIQSWQ